MIALSLRFAAFITIALGITNIATNEFLLSGFTLGKNLATMFSFVFLIVLQFYGMKTARNMIYAGEATYGQMFYSGIVLAAFSAIGAGMVTIVYFQFIRPDFNTLIIPVIEQAMREQKAPIDEIRKEVDLLKEGYSVSSAFAGVVVYTTLVMTIIATVLASFLRTRDTFTADRYDTPGPDDLLNKRT